MPFTYNYVNEQDFSSGIDEFSAENAITEGSVSQALNVDIKEKRLQKRKGYQAYAGCLPIRIESVTYKDVDSLPPASTLDTIELRLNSSLDLIKVRNVPILIYGRTALSGGPFTSTNAAYFYDKIDTDPRKTFIGTSTTLQDHGFLTTNFFSGISESTAELTYDSNWVEMNEVRIDKTTYALTLDYLNAPSNRVFSYYLQSDPVAGQAYNKLFTGSSVTITAGEHNFDNYNIIYDCFQDNGTEWKRVVPHNFVLNRVTGQVDVTFSQSGTYKLLLRAVPGLNYKETTALGDTTLTLLGNDNPFIFHTCYYQTGTNTWDECKPNSVVYDDTNNQHIFTFSQVYASSTIVVFWEAGNVQTNIVRIKNISLTASGEDASPQLTLWGICHNIPSIYGQFKIAREGWVNFIDSYKSAGESYLLSGLGGNLYRAGNDSAYQLPSRFTNLRNRIMSDVTIGPAFYGLTDTPSRTRGYIKSSSTGSNWATITDIAYNSGTGWVDITMSLPGRVISGTPISTTTDLNDWLTVQQAGYKIMNGTFKIMAIDTSIANTLICSVKNPKVSSSDYDETDVGGMGGIFTDWLPWQSANYFVSQDQLRSDVFAADQVIRIVSQSGTTSVVNDVDIPITLPLGLRVTGKRSSRVIPLRDELDNPQINYFLASDTIGYSNIARQPEILSVYHENMTISIVGNGTEALATISGNNTSGLDVGYWINLTDAGEFSGEQQITEVVDQFSFKFSHSTTGTHSGILQGHALAIDEKLEWEDNTDNSTIITVPKRWLPVEAPDVGGIPTYKTYYWDANLYSLQDFVRSCMVSDNMYLTNYSDEVLKYDGIQLYRAGLPRWQCGIFATIETGTGIIVPQATAQNVQQVTGSYFTFNAGDEEYFTVGDKVVHSGDGATYTVIEVNTVAHTVRVNNTISSGTHGTLTTVNVSNYRYYFRLNAVDVNNNVIASAAVGHENFRIELAQTSAIHLKLVGMPKWDIYDFDKLEIAIYRTKANTQAPFYRIANVPLSYSANTGYLEFVDSYSDTALVELDTVTTALMGAELGSGWNEPLRAKYCTSLGNRLILGNIKDYPKLDITFDGSNIQRSQFNNKIMQFERTEFNVAPTVTDNTSCQRYEFVTSSQTVSCSYSGSTLTVTPIAPISGLIAGNWVYLFHATAGSNNALTGWFQVATVTGSPVTSFTITHVGLNNNGTKPTQMALATQYTDIPVFLGTDYNYNYLRGNSSFVQTEAALRLANAINCVNRLISTPWLIANGDDTLGTGRITVSQSKVESGVPWVRLPTLTGINMYVSGIKQSNGAYLESGTRVYPSRVVISYENYPEIFDSPTEILQQNSDSVIDINSADGQQITGMIPFFGDSTFGARQKANVLVVFKEHSVYVVDLDQKAAGQPAVQKLETHGVGCQAPYSIAYSKYGIMFANYSGVYILRRDLSIQYIGKYIERKWLESANRDQMAIMQGHHYALGKMYKLSIPVGTGTEPSEVLVYHHTNEDNVVQQGYGITSGKGGWTYYDNHAAIGWANLSSDAFFANTAGQVLSVRNTGTASDYRDAAAPVNAIVTTRAIDFGAGGIRKVVDSIITHYRTNIQINGASLNYAVDLEREFHGTDAFKIQQVTAIDGISSPINRSVISIKSDVGRRKGIYFQFQWINDTIDEPLDIAGFTVKVAGLTDSGITQAADT